jgi:hypothetical protein
VQSAIHGANPHETAVRVSAALEVLQYFVYGMIGEHGPAHPGMPSERDPGFPVRGGCPPDCTKRLGEYTSAKYVVLRKMISGEPPPPPNHNPQFYAEIERSHLSEDRKFGAEVLAKFVSPSSRDAYFTTTADWYKRNETIKAAVAARDNDTSGDPPECANARMLLAAGLADNAEPLQRACEAKRHAAAAAADAAKHLVRRGGGMTLFGVAQFGTPLQLPSGGRSLGLMTMRTAIGNMLFPDLPTTCVGGRDEMSTQMATEMLRAQGNLPSNVDFALVSLGTDSSPDWKQGAGNCIMSVALVDGLVASVAVETGNQSWETKINRALGEKFKAALRPPKQAPITCESAGDYNNYPAKASGSLFSWDMPDVVAAYWTTDGGNRTQGDPSVCSKGRVIISTKAFQGSLEQGAALHDKSQPQL